MDVRRRLLCGAVLTEMIEGKTVNEAKRLTPEDILNQIGGLSSRKQHAAAQAIETLHGAIDASR